MEVTYIDGSEHGQETIAQAAGVCYGNPDRDVGRIKRLKAHKHLATFRFAFAVIRIEGISIACQNQLVRSKHLDFLVESKRYVDASNMKFVMPNTEYEEEISEHVKATMELYTKLVASGVPKEDARSILPMNTTTNLYVCGNLQAWIDMLKLRVSKHAQQEIREMAIECWELLIKKFPLVFEDLKYEDKGIEEWQNIIKKN